MMYSQTHSPQEKPAAAAAAPRWHGWMMPALCLVVFASLGVAGWRYQSELTTLWETPRRRFSWSMIDWQSSMHSPQM